MSVEPQEFGVRRNVKKEKIGIIQNKRAAKCLGEVPSIVIPSIFIEMLQRSCQRKRCRKDKRE